MVSDHFPARLRSLMDAAGVSVSVLAAKAGVNRQYLHRLLSGERSPSLDVAERLANALGKRLRAFEE